GLEARMAALVNHPETGAADGAADGNGWKVADVVAHPVPLGGIEGEVQVPDDHLALAGFGEGHFPKADVVAGGNAHGALVEVELAVAGSGHGRLPVMGFYRCWWGRICPSKNKSKQA